MTGLGAGRRATGAATSSTADRMSNQEVAHKLVIVESPAKARTIAGYLGRGYVVESSIGHIRDLPAERRRHPGQAQGRAVGPPGRRRRQRLRARLRGLARQEVAHEQAQAPAQGRRRALLATDEDREGEAIAWHLLDELKPKVPVRRMVFHEITPQAIQAGGREPRELDIDLVEAQEARRILDRLYGYEVRPVLWKKVMRGLSAGRVQSVATRLVVDRERERMRSAPRRTGTSRAPSTPATQHDQRMFPAKLSRVDGTPGRPRPRLRLDDGAAASRAPTSCHLDQGRRRGARRRAARHDLRGRARSSRSPTPASPTPRSGRRRCSRRPAASSVRRLAHDVGRRSGSTRTASSPTCGPTRRRCRRRRSTRPATRSASCTAPSTSRRPAHLRPR